MTEYNINPDELANEIDDVLSVNPQAEHPHPYVQTALRLANAPKPRLASDAMARIQAKMMAAHTAQHQEETVVKESPKVIRPVFRTPAAFRRVAAIVIALMVIGFGSLPSMANSMPGDFLYPVKRDVVEKIEISLASSAYSRADTYLTQANRRLDEADKMIDRGKFEDVLITDALTNMETATQLTYQNGFSDNDVAKLQADTAQLDSKMDLVLKSADEANVISDEQFTTLNDLVEASRNNGKLLLPTSATAPDMGIVFGDGDINVRYDPASDAIVVTTVRDGTQVSIVGYDVTGNWLQVELPDGRVGWMEESSIIYRH